MPYNCTKARVGDVVVAYDQTYEVVEIDDWGQAVCRNLREDCLHSDYARTFQDADFDRLIPGDTPDLFTGMGI